MMDISEHRGQRPKFCNRVYYSLTLFKDTYSYAKTCGKCQKVGNISKGNELSQYGFLELQVFNVLGIDFMGPLLSPFRIL